MGKLIWSQWANVIAIVAAFWGVFGLFFRYSVFNNIPSIENTVVNPVNIFAIICIVTGILVLVLELFVKRYFVARAVLYVLIAGASVLNYENTNPSLYLIISAAMYITAEFQSENVVHKTTGATGKGNVSMDEKTATGTPNNV
ncbi:7340_t:CDS:2 [Paraglomus brasilianum]|uniref:7340_t:CDS:1 n=1 Tax=Paraglomus brasilianum TaxID=144538 RepID=A0A9N9H0I6_9GLOM|nr:7340_t:CDS:2 [Paraglomus brasilianum]